MGQLISDQTRQEIQQTIDTVNNMPRPTTASKRRVIRGGGGGSALVYIEITADTNISTYTGTIYDNPITRTEVEVDVTTPLVYALEQNYPNPFNPSTTINFSIGDPGIVKLALYNLLGQEVKLLVNEFKEAGPHTITFDASSLPSGSYFYTLEISHFKQTKKMILAK